MCVAEELGDVVVQETWEGAITESRSGDKELGVVRKKGGV
jgi:hypothetical protein